MAEVLESVGEFWITRMCFPQAFDNLERLDNLESLEHLESLEAER